ncbi:sensor histidine kinase [Gorillibacterium sp. sgz5001074]|uniref:sensor histidine kinase n=1 Tax=Gorillibacterium sp. sgz5001074 TaxID=3446695 RepID=UPI003F668A38
MRTKWMRWWRGLWGDELFRKTERRLTLLYSGVLISFLALFVGIVYMLLRYMIISDQNQELRALADRQQRMVQNHVRMVRTLDGQLKNNPDIMAGSENQLFTYILGSKGQLIQSMEAGRWDKAPLMAAIQSWTGSESKIRETTISYTPGSPDERRGPRAYRQILQKGQSGQIRLLVTGRPIMLGETQVGSVYIGLNVSYSYELLNWMLLVLCGIALMFFAGALWISYALSRRAMIPVRRSYRLQREFVADASHELRTPLSVIQSSVEALELEQSEETDPFVRRLTATMKDEVKRMAKLTGDLLTLARSDSTEHQIMRESFDFGPPARSVTEAMQAVSESKGVRLEALIPESLPAVGDLERLKQLMYILLDNAVKYTPEGGAVRVELRDEGKDPGRSLVLIVSDTGAGISQEDLPRIFDRFYRADKSRTRQSGGHGLGLSIAQWIVQSHNGTIRAASIPGQGSTFTVQIPV